MSLPRVDLETAVAITSNPVVANDNRTSAIQVFVQGTDGQVNHLYVSQSPNLVPRLPNWSNGRHVSYIWVVSYLTASFSLLFLAQVQANQDIAQVTPNSFCSEEHGKASLLVIALHHLLDDAISCLRPLTSLSGI